MKTRTRVLGLVGVIGACGAAFAGGVWTGVNRAQTSSEWVDGRLISTAIDSVRANALDSLPSDELIRRAVAGMLRELHDPYAALLRPDGFERYRGSLQGDGRGLGLAMRRQAGEVSVEHVVKGSPAWSRGVRAGDRILSVNGVPALQAWSNRDSTSASSDSTQLQLQRAPSGDTISVSIERAEWHAPAVSVSAFVAEGVGYVHLTSVSSRSATEVEEAVEELLERGAQSLILDLRGNAGGLFDEGVRIASLFLPRGVVVASVAGRADVEPQVHEARRTRWSNLPITVLINEGTASSAELIAAALRDHRRAILVGSRSYGKGLVQRVVRLSPELALRLTTARWLPPGGEVIVRREGRGVAAKGGVAPDVLLEDASRFDPFSIPSGWNAEAASRISRTADSAAVEAMRGEWATAPIAVLEQRLRNRIIQLAPRAQMPDVPYANWVGIATRLATVRVLQAGDNEELLLRYRAREDASIRAGLEVVAPGIESASVIPSETRRARLGAAAAGAVRSDGVRN